MAQPGATTSRRMGRAGAAPGRKTPVLVARAPWPETPEPPVHGRWPRAAGLALAMAVSALLWALLVWGICVLLR